MQLYFQFPDDAYHTLYFVCIKNWISQFIKTKLLFINLVVSQNSKSIQNIWLSFCFES